MIDSVATNNPRTNNFALLLLELISLLNQFPAQIESTHNTISKTLHAIFLVRVFSKFLIETCPTEKVFSYFQLQKGVSKSPNTSQPSKQVPIGYEIKEGKQEIPSSNLLAASNPITASSATEDTSDEEELTDLLLKALLDFLIEKPVRFDFPHHISHQVLLPMKFM